MTLPSDQALEGVVLGIAMNDLGAAVEITTDLDGVDFTQPVHREVFAAIRELHERDATPDSAAVVNELKARGRIEKLSDSIPYIRALAMSAPDEVNTAEYTTRLKSLSLRRELIAHATDAVKQSGDMQVSAEALVDRLAARVTDLSLSHRNKRTDAKPLSEILVQEFNRLRKEAEESEERLGVRTGFYDLDEKLCGLHAGEFLILAGRPSMGKTALALEAARYAAIHDDLPVLFFSLEMSDRALVHRLLSGSARVDGQALRRPRRVSADGWSRLTDAAGKLDTKRLLVSDKPDITVLDIRSQARWCQQRYGVALVVVDYLQLVRPAARQQNREREVAEISLGLKNLARELRIPVMCLCQLNRALEARENKRPRLSDLRESGSLEQDADVVCFVNRPSYYDDSKPEDLAEVIVAKQRNGPLGIIELGWDARSVRFYNHHRGAQ